MKTLRTILIMFAAGLFMASECVDSDSAYVPPTHDCSLTKDTIWDTRQLSLDHSDSRICPVNVPLGGSVQTTYRIYDGRYAANLYPNEPASGHSWYGVVDVFEYVGGPVVSSDTEYFAWMLCCGTSNWAWGAYLSPARYNRQDNSDWVLFDVHFYQAAGIANAQMTLTYYTGNDQ